MPRGECRVVSALAEAGSVSWERGAGDGFPWSASDVLSGASASVNGFYIS